jgi:hypothetical protein
MMIISKCDFEIAGLINISIGDPVAEIRRVVLSDKTT